MRHCVVFVLGLAACSIVSTEAQEKEALERFCGAYAEVLAEGESPSDWVSVEVAKRYGDGPMLNWAGRELVLDIHQQPATKERTERLRSTAEAHGLEDACAPAVAEYEANAITARVIKAPSPVTVEGRGFVLGSNSQLSVWDEPPFDGLAEAGGFALTDVEKSSIRHPLFITLTPLTLSPTDCEAWAKTTMDARSETIDYAKTISLPSRDQPADAAPRNDCFARAKPSAPHRVFLAWVLHYDFGVFRLTCEGDDRVSNHREFCGNITSLGQIRPPEKPDDPNRNRFELPLIRPGWAP